MSVCAVPIVGLVGTEAGATPSEAAPTRVCSGQSAIGSTELGSAPDFIKIFVPANGMIDVHAVFQVLSPDPDGVWRSHTRIEELSPKLSGTASVYADRVRSGSSFHGEDEYWTSGYQAPVDRTMVLKVSELDGRAFRYRIDFREDGG